MRFTKITLITMALNFLIIGISSAYYYVIPQVFFSLPKEMAMIYYRCTSSSVAIENAVSDFNKGNYFLINWGLPDGNYEKLITVKSILEVDYNVKILHGGCTSIPEINCYSNKMNELLVKKHGHYYFRNAFRKAVNLNNGINPPQ